MPVMEIGSVGGDELNRNCLPFLNQDNAHSSPVGSNLQTKKHE